MSLGTETVDVGAARLTPQPCVIVLSGAERGLAFWIDKPYTLIGRGEDCDLRIDESSISRHHAAIERVEQQQWFLLDLASKNGSFVGAQTCADRAALRDGDLLRLGRVGLQFFMVQGIAQNSARDNLRAGALVLDPLREVAIVDERVVELTKTEYRMLAALMQRPGRLLSQLALMRAAYPDERVVSESTVQSHLRNLRRKLGNQGDGREWIRSLYGRGYRLELGEALQD